MAHSNGLNNIDIFPGCTSNISDITSCEAGEGVQELVVVVPDVVLHVVPEVHCNTQRQYQCSTVSTAAVRSVLQ